MEKNFLERTWWMLLVRGVLAILFGVVAMVWPDITAIAFAVVWGFWALVDGIVSIVGAFQRDATGKVWLVVFGIISVIAGLIAIVHPGDVAIILTWVLGVWFIVTAVFQAIGAFSSARTQPRWLLLVSAVLSLLIGILFVARPGTGVLAIVIWVGIVAIAWGIVLVVTSFYARSLGKDLDAAMNRPEPA